MTEKPMGERVARIEEWLEGIDEDVDMLKAWKSTVSREVDTLSHKVGVGQHAFDRTLNVLQAVGIGVLIYFFQKG